MELETGLTTAITSPPNPVVFTTPVPDYSSSSLTVTLENTGSLPLILPSADTAIGGNNSGDFSVTMDGCQGTTVQPGGNCMIQVTFAPSSVGTLTGQMTIYANVYGGQLPYVEFIGTGTAAGLVTLTPSTINFDPSPGQSSALPLVLVGGTPSGTEQVEAGNSGTAPVTITSVAITPPFTISSNQCTSSLAAGADCQLLLAFAPTQRGAATGALTFTEGSNTQSVVLSGFGWAPPSDGLSATSLSFGGIETGQSSPVQTVTLSDTGDLPVTVIAITLSGPFTESDNCNGQLAANYPLATCVIRVQFAPNASQLGAQTGTLTVTDELNGVPHTQKVPLSGTGLAPPEISYSPSAGLIFSTQTIGMASSPLPLTVTNTGGVAMANLSFTIPGSAVPGSPASYFTIGATTCPTASGSTLAAGSNCTVQVTFTPMAAGGSTASLTISSANATAASAPLSGSGQAIAGLNVNPPQLTFAPQSPGLSSPPLTITISNSASVAAVTPTLTVSNTQFSLTASTCTGNVGGGSSCTVGVIYTPTANLGAGTTAAGILTVSSITFLTQATVALSGMVGGAGAIQAAPSPISFGTVGVNAVSNPVTVTVTNPWTTTVMDGLTLAFPAGFQAASGTNTCTASLGPGASCTVGVVFAPTSAGAQSGTLSVTSSAASASGSVALSGTGFDFSVAVSGSNTQTVAAGQIAYYTIAISPLTGSPGGNFTFACGTLPSYALCIFDPTSETASGGGTGSVTVEVSTGQSTTSSLSAGPAKGRALPFACGLILLPLALTPAWKRRRKFLLMGALLAILDGGISSCVGSLAGSVPSCKTDCSGSGLTPPGTYTITVNVTSNGVTHALAAPTGPLTLTVD